MIVMSLELLQSVRRRELQVSPVVLDTMFSNVIEMFTDHYNTVVVYHSSHLFPVVVNDGSLPLNRAKIRLINTTLMALLFPETGRG